LFKYIVELNGRTIKKQAGVALKKLQPAFFIARSGFGPSRQVERQRNPAAFQAGFESCRAYHEKEAGRGSVETITCFFCASGRI
jgi:hypothetical protein